MERSEASGSVTGTPVLNRWVRDGHTAVVVLDEDALVVRLNCPYDATDWRGVEWDHLPSCRKSFDEYGQPAPQDAPLGYCNFREWANNMGVIDSIDAKITSSRLFYPKGEFPVGWRWSPEDEMYLWAPSALIDLVEADTDV